MIKVNGQDLRPSIFSEWQHLHPAIKADMEDLYGSPDKAARCLASIINHCFTSRVDTVIITKRFLQEAIEEDCNQLKKFSIDSNLYKRFCRLNVSGPHFSLHVSVSKKLSNVARLASVYKICRTSPLIALINLTKEELEYQSEILEHVIKEYRKIPSEELTSGREPENAT